MKKRDTGGASQRLIEDNLKRVYRQTLEEDVPDRFKDLLNRLKQGPEADQTETDDGTDGNKA